MEKNKEDLERFFNEKFLSIKEYIIGFPFVIGVSSEIKKIRRNYHFIAIILYEKFALKKDIDIIEKRISTEGVTIKRKTKKGFIYTEFIL